MTGWLGDIARWLCGGATLTSAISGRLPKYVELDGDWSRRHPGRLEKVTMHLFPLKAQSRDSLEALCRDMVNNQSPSVHVKPYLSGVLVAIVENQWAYSDQGGDKDRGHLNYKEAGIFVPVKLSLPSGFFGVAAIVPYLFADQFSAIVTGRESYGFPKQIADFHSNSAARHFWVRADVFPEFKRAQPVQRAIVLEVLPKGEIKERPILTESTEEAMRKIGRQIVKDLGGSSEEVEDVRRFREVALVLLKQIRDATDASLACHQSLVKADCEITKLRKSPTWLCGSFSIKMPHFRSLCMAETLGLAIESTAPHGLRLELDFTLHSGETLWKAP